MNTPDRKSVCSDSKIETLEQTVKFAQGLQERQYNILEFHTFS